jgi:pimeloyl-ACP methyl ester carboxylesterase
MNTVTSKDGTRIAFDKAGSGPTLVIVGGAFSYRRYPMLAKLTELLADRFTVINYDRRGRGDSTDTQPYAVAREIEDLAALIEAAGGPAFVFGISSGGVLSLRAAAAGLDIAKLAIYQPPFLVDSAGPLPPAGFAEHLDQLLASGRRGAAVQYFMTKGMGAPAFFIGMMRLLPLWSRLKAVANTLPYDFAVMGDAVTGKPLVEREWAGVGAPTLVLSGGKSPARVGRSAAAAAEVLPDAQHRVLDGQGLAVRPEALVPVLVEHFSL